MSSSPMNSSIDKMKTEGNKWSSLDEVLDSFNNVSLMPTLRNVSGNDIFANPNLSPPKHRISPSQLELLESLGGCKLNMTNSKVLQPSCMSMGRGRVMRNLDKINVKERDAALSRDIRATKSSGYSNAAIENYFNNLSYFNSNEEEKSDDSTSSEEIIKSPDQVSINSLLRPDAEDFYPPGVAPPNSEELSNYLVNLKEEREAVASFCKKSMPPYSPRQHRHKPKRSDNHIGFKTKKFYNDSENKNDISDSKTVDVSTYLDSITTYSSGSNLSLSNVSGSTLPVPEPPIDLRSKGEEIKSIDMQRSNHLEANKEHRPKRVMKNALFSSLSSKHQEDEPHHLMKPMDFNIGSSSSAFHPVSSVKSNAHQLDYLYDFQSDPSIDSDSKDLINYLTSESSESCSTVSPLPNYSKKVKKPSRSSKLQSPYQPYSFNDQDFPPLS